MAQAGEWLGRGGSALTPRPHLFNIARAPLGSGWERRNQHNFPGVFLRQGWGGWSPGAGHKEERSIDGKRGDSGAWETAKCILLPPVRVRSKALWF